MNPPLNVLRPADGLYTLVPACAPNSALDVINKRTDNEAKLHIWQKDPLTTSSQQWQLERVDGDYYTIKNRNSGRVASIKYNYTASGSTVWQYSYGSSNAQKWRFEDAGNGYFYISPKNAPGLCLDVSKASSENGANVQVYTRNQANAQKWKLVPVTCTSHVKGVGGYCQGAHPHYNYYYCAICGEAFTDGVEGYSSSCEICNPKSSWDPFGIISSDPPAEESPTQKNPWNPFQDSASKKEEEPAPTPTPAPTPQKPAASTLKVEGLKATVDESGITVSYTASSNYDLSGYAININPASGLSRNIIGSYPSATSYNGVDSLSLPGNAYKGEQMPLYLQVSDLSGKEVETTTTITMPFDTDKNGKPIKTTITFHSLTTPGTLKVGQAGPIGGSITTSGSPIVSVKAKTVDASTGKTVLTAASSGFSVTTYGPLKNSKIDADLKFNTLSAGTYYIEYTVTTQDGTTSTEKTGTFTVKR